MLRRDFIKVAGFSACSLAVQRVCSLGAPAGKAETREGDSLSTLRAEAEKRGFLIGAAVDVSHLGDPDYAAALKREFNICVPENAYKMSCLQPVRGTFKFGDADRLAEFAAANKIKLRGHTLVWHQQVPKWLSGGSWTREEALAAMKEHITTVMNHFKGKVYAWDVVNEAVSNEGPHDIRNDKAWGKLVGQDYVEKAFEFARAADPGAILYYNDYSAEDSGPKSDAVYRLVKRLKESNLVDGVGWQCHFTSGWKAGAGHARNAERLHQLGLEISVTELDLRIQMPSTPEKLAEQAESYRSMMQFCLGQPNIKALLMWGFTDKYSWIPGYMKGFGDALILDNEYRQKPAYRALAAVLREGAAHQDDSTR